ncbi:MAG: hypothetical protein JWN12_89 [Candidatus Saccharibacteria bacterium]|nr:hypothetical protein [Candidatus Saccharibacteria bacterium]
MLQLNYDNFACDRKALRGNMSTIDQQFIEYIVKSVVGHPDDVVVDRIIDEKGVLLTLTVNPEDLGRVIGKRGITAQSLRTLLRALGTKNDARYNLKIVNNDGQDGPIIASYTPASKVDESSDNVSDLTESIPPVETSTDEPVDKESNYTKKTRAELAEFDDLDI